MTEAQSMWVATCAPVIGFLLGVVLVEGCGTLKQVGRTINDAATVLCELYAVDANPEQLNGLTPSDYCAIHDHLEPFIEEALAAKQAAAMKLQQREAE
jgi:hypothetical protein